jgi:hypothetical protein
MAITLFGTAKDPSSENAANAGPTAVVVPPGSMLANDYVVVLAAYRGTGVTLAVGTDGGQSWTSETARTQGTVITSRLFRCKFNGTWSNNPDFTVTAGTNGIIAYLSAWRGVDPSTPIDTALAQTGFAAPANPYDVVRAGLTTTYDNAVAIYWWLSSDNNTWALQGSPGLTQPEAMWRQTTTTGLSVSMGYKTIATGGSASGDATNRQTALGGDAGTTHIISLKPAIILPPPFQTRPFGTTVRSRPVATRRA